MVLSYAACHHCENCLSNHPSACEEFNTLNFGGRREDGTTPYRLGDQDLSLFFGQSSFSQYVVTRASNAVVVDPEVDLTSPARPAGLWHPDRQRDGAQPPETGDWGIHCGVWLRRRGAQRHHGGEINRLFADHRCRYSCQSPRPAGELGATHQINGKEQDAVALIKQITGKGAHYAVETTGVSAIVLQAVHAVKPLGTVAIVGFYRGYQILTCRTI